MALFLSTEDEVLIVDGKAIRPPIGRVTWMKVRSREKPRASPASRNWSGTA